jgi:DNA-binding NarL/FixJ family response regulator
MKKIRILIADDHEMVRMGMRALIERLGNYEICGEAATGREAVELVEKLAPEIAILDIGMPELNGLDATRIIKRTHPQTEILIFTTNESEELVRSVFRAGAKSYLLKSDATKHIPLALAALCMHRTYFSTKIAEVIFAGFVEGEKISEPSPLTARERETIQLIAEGKSNKEMAAILGISVKTVETHRAALLKKLNLGSVAEVVRYAIRNDITEV